jgi:integrase
MRRALEAAARGTKNDIVKTTRLRSSFVTLAKDGGRLVRPAEHGLDLEIIAAVTGHTNTKTTRDFYDDTDVPPMIVVPLRLQHPDEPS